jgi:hypothetical protein
MAYLVHNLPPIHVQVKKEYLYDLEKGHGEYTPGIWISVKSIRGKALYFETLLTDYGALYDKLPLSAFVWKTPEEELPLDALQLWDCFDYDITVIKKPFLNKCKFYAKNRKYYEGNYLFTIDTCHDNDSMLDQNFSEYDSEHKSFNVIKLTNGQFAAQPNNRVLWLDNSLIPEKTLISDFKVCNQNYSVEEKDKWSVGHTSEWQYKSLKEENNDL